MVATIYLVTGAPCSGKTTFVRDHAGPHDLVLDQDVLGVAEMQRQVATLHQHEGVAWVIRCCPGPAARQALATQLGAQLIHLDPDTATLMARAGQRAHPHRARAAVRKWIAEEAAGGRPGTRDPACEPITQW